MSSWSDLGSGRSEIYIIYTRNKLTIDKPFLEYPDDAWQKIMDLNVRHVFNLTRLLTAKLAKGGSKEDPARVVLISSIDGVRASQTFGPTAAFACKLNPKR